MIDELDIGIIRELQRDSSLSYSEIARVLNQNESTIRKRVLSLREHGVIKKFSIILDNSKVGYNTIAIIGIDVEPSQLLDISQKISLFEETRSVATSTGDHMIMSEVWAKDGKELSQVISKIGSLPGVKKLCPAILMEKIKEV